MTCSDHVAGDVHWVPSAGAAMENALPLEGQRCAFSGFWRREAHGPGVAGGGEASVVGWQVAVVSSGLFSVPTSLVFPSPSGSGLTHLASVYPEYLSKGSAPITC